jgi:hypothetical protein
MNGNKKNNYKLEDHKRKDLFTVPDQYFELLPQRIQNRIVHDSATSWYSRLLSKPSLRIGSAFAVILLLVTSVFLFKDNPENTSSSPMSVASFAEVDVYEYLIENELYSDAEIINAVENEMVESGISYTTNEEEEVLEALDPYEVEELIIEL